MRLIVVCIWTLLLRLEPAWACAFVLLMHDTLRLLLHKKESFLNVVSDFKANQICHVYFLDGSDLYIP